MEILYSKKKISFPAGGMDISWVLLRDKRYDYDKYSTGHHMCVWVRVELCIDSLCFSWKEM